MRLYHKATGRSLKELLKARSKTIGAPRYLRKLIFESVPKVGGQINK